MNVERAAEIIAAYGGNSARWPADERVAVLRLVGAHVALAPARRDASAFDADLSSWSHDWRGSQNAPGDAAAAAARVLAARCPTAHVAVRPARPVWRWAVGTGMAAATAAGVMLTNLFAAPPHTPVSHSAAYRGPATDAAAFAMVFTPTPDEDNSI